MPGITHPKAPANKKRPVTSNAYNHNPILLTIYLYYRFILAAILYFSYKFDLASNVLGSSNPQLYEWTSILYGVICFGSLFVFRPQMLQRSLNRISMLLIIDLLAVLLVIHSSDGTGNGLDYLLVICVATASIFIRGQMSLSFATLTTLFTFAEAIYTSQTTRQFTEELFSAGILGILMFGTAIVFHYLTKKIRTSEEEAAKQANQVKQLQQLAEDIVARMRTGVIVLDEEDKIELVNKSALQLLDLNPQDSHIGQHIDSFSNLNELLQQWKLNPSSGVSSHHVLRAGQEIKISFASQEVSEHLRTILYLEDYRALAQQAQQLKLASLGGLTASIAHEIRNPLGAIAHAAQLLSESDSISKGDIRLTEIILQHSKRVNQIIENTLVLSRRKQAKPRVILLDDFLPGFIEDFKTIKNCDISLHFPDRSISIKMDTTHLTQVLTNLCENGIRYSKATSGVAHVLIEVGISPNDDVPFIKVIDDGPGIAEEDLNQIFDPFYTTDEKGSGLGLYISRELCEINQANLFFERTQEGKSCFKLYLSHHQRMI